MFVKVSESSLNPIDKRENGAPLWGVEPIIPAYDNDAISPDLGIAAYIIVFRGLSLSSPQLVRAILIHVIHNCCRTINIVVAGIGDQLHARRCPAHPAGTRDHHVRRGSGSRPPCGLKLRNVNYPASRPSENGWPRCHFCLDRHEKVHRQERFLKAQRVSGRGGVDSISL
jgi:hypothetical protein